MGDRHVVLHGDQRGVAVGRHPWRGDGEDVVEARPSRSVRAVELGLSASEVVVVDDDLCGGVARGGQVLPQQVDASAARERRGRPSPPAVWPPTAPATPKTATARTSQTAKVRHGWVAANRPSRSRVRFIMVSLRSSVRRPSRAALAAGLVTDLGALGDWFRGSGLGALAPQPPSAGSVVEVRGALATASKPARTRLEPHPLPVPLQPVAVRREPPLVGHRERRVGALGGLGLLADGGEREREVAVERAR